MRAMRVASERPGGDVTGVPKMVLRSSLPQTRKVRLAVKLLGLETLSTAIVPRPMVTRLSFCTLRDCFWISAEASSRPIPVMLCR